MNHCFYWIIIIKKNSRSNSPPHCPLRSLRLPQWSRTAISVDVRVGPIHQRAMGNGINRWQWSSASQTMAHKHPLTSGQMRESQDGGWVKVWGIVCELVCVFMCVHPHVWVSQTEREPVTRGEMMLQRSREMVRKISPWGWCGGPTRYLWKQMSPVGRSSDMPQLILRVCLPYFPLYLPFSHSFKMSFYLSFV